MTWTGKTFIATAETQEAYDIANGTVRVYAPDEWHNEGHVWDEAKGEMPYGVWLSPCGNWRTIYTDDPYGPDGTSRNFCYCPFWKSLRQTHRARKNNKADNARKREAHDAYVANRKEAGRVIDIETCEIRGFRANYFDPYGTYPFDDDPPDDLSEQRRDDCSKCWFVRSKESGGWIVSSDLPPEKQQAMHDRIAREARLVSAACAAHPLWKAHDVYWKWIGDDQAPSQDAMIKWFKASYPAQAREVERRAQDQGGDRRPVFWGELLAPPF